MSFFGIVKRGARIEPVDDTPPENLPKEKCKYCGHLFRPWILPASGQHAISCPFCSIIAVHLFNRQPMPAWLKDYKIGHDGLSEVEYAKAVNHLQYLLAQALPNPQPPVKQLPEDTDPFGRTIRED